MLLGCEAKAPPSFADADRKAIERLLADQQAAWNRGDLDAFLAGYERSDQLIFTSGAKIRRGFSETEQKYRERYGSSTQTMGKLEFELLEIRGIGPDAALVLGRYTLRDTPEAGSGIFSLVFERQADGWKIVHDHTSAEPAPASK